MNEFSRRGFLGIAGAAGIAGLSACAGTGTATSGSGGGSSNTIEFWSNHPGNSKPVEQEIIKAFEAANPSLKVKLVDAGKNYEEVAQKFNASLAGGQLPDVVVVSDVTWFNFALNKQLTALDDLLSEPKAAAGSDKIVMELPDGSNYLDWVFQNMVWGYGGAYSKEWTPTFSDPGTVKAGQYLQDLAKQGFLKLSKDPAPDFTAGIVACSMMSTGSLGGVAKDAKFGVGTAFLRGEGNCPTGGAGVGIPATISDDRKKNALKFIEFLTNAQNTVTFTQATGYMPVRKSAVDLPEEKAFLEKNPNAKTAIEQLPKTRSQDNVRVLLPGGGARIGKGLDQIVQGQDVATVFKGLDADSQQVFDSQIKSKLSA